jgi:hypothetical protein
MLKYGVGMFNASLKQLLYNPKLSSPISKSAVCLEVNLQVTDYHVSPTRLKEEKKSSNRTSLVVCTLFS